MFLDSYFSATKYAWMLEHGDLDVAPGSLALGTVHSWVLWKLTGGPKGGVFATDPTNAARTLLFDIHAREWSAELCAPFYVPRSALAEVRPSCGRFGSVDSSATTPSLAGVPVAGIAGDQQSALFGQACFEPGMV